MERGRKKISKSMEIVHDLARVCEFFYRKGVLDGSSCGDPTEVYLCSKREDNNMTLRFLRDDGGKELKYRYYISYVQFFCSKIGAKNLRNVIAYIPGERQFFSAICIICDKYYRDGLEDGVKTDILKAKKYFNENPRFSDHNRLSGLGYARPFWLDTIKYDCNRIFVRQSAEGKNSGMLKLASYIMDTISENYNGGRY